jgi:predicted dehydrogenase
LRLGVIGLGASWSRRYAPTLDRLRHLFQVVAVCDPVGRLARQEAQRLHCSAAAGPTALLETTDLDALLLLGGPWYGSWPLSLACRCRMPVFCGAPLEGDADEAEPLYQRIEATRLPVMAALPERSTPAARRLRRLADDLGPVLSVTLEREERSCGSGSRLLFGRAGSSLVDWCADFLPAAPTAVTAAAGAGLASAVFEFADGRAAHIVRRCGPALVPGVRMTVVCERGRAVAEQPGLVRWRTSRGRREESLPVRRRSTQLLLEQFARALAQGRPPTPSFADARRTLPWLRAAERSRAEGRRVVVEATVEASLTSGGGV